MLVKQPHSGLVAGYQTINFIREAAEAALDQLLLMTATFSTTWNSTEKKSYLEKSHSLALLRVTLKGFLK